MNTLLRLLPATLASRIFALYAVALLIGVLGGVLGGLALGLLGMGLAWFAMRWAMGRWLGGLEQLHSAIEKLGTHTGTASSLVVPHAPAEIQRVVDMFNQTATLLREREATRAALDQQKFALDQHAIVSITDGQGTITYANDQFCALSGYSREELLGRNQREIRAGDQTQAFYDDIWATVSAGKVWHGEMCHRKRNGALYWVNATIVPMQSEVGASTQYITIRTDISDRKAMETSLVQAKEAAEQASVAKSQFLANMSHEIRTPMNAILGMLQLLQNTELTATQIDYASKTEGAARSLLGLLNDILDFSKVEAGKMSLDLQPFSLTQVMGDLAVILSGNVGHKRLVVRQQVAADVPPGLLGDAMRLQQVLVNLGGNAVKFTTEGEVVLQVQVLERSAREVVLHFSVRDTGIGIAPENMGHIFEGFSQAEASTTRRFGGTGLGLAICQRLVRLMGGELQLESKLGKGSNFHFTLRLALADLPQVQAAPAAAVPGGKAQRLLGLRLLVVEDNKINQMVAKGLLAQEGAEVTLAENGLFGVQAVQTAYDAQMPFDVVLMDLQMPEMDGFEATRLIRQTHSAKALPIVAMTANAMASDREACLAVGMNDHVGKPFELNHLVGVLLQHSLRPAQPAATAAAAKVESSAVASTPPPAQGLDVQNALARLGGDREVYAMTLEAFLDELGTTPAQLQSYIDSARWEEAARALHTLKGLSATVGALRLRSVAAALETRVKQGLPAHESAQVLGTLREAVGDTVQSIAPVLLQFKGAPLPTDAPILSPQGLSDEVRVQLQALHAMLLKEDLTALKAYATLRRVLPAQVQPAAFSALDAAMVALEFVPAAQACMACLQESSP